MKTSFAHVTSKFFHHVNSWRRFLITVTVCVAVLGIGSTPVTASSARAIESLPRSVRPSYGDDDAAKIADEEAKKVAEAAEKAAKIADEEAKKVAEAAEKAAKEVREAAKKVREAGENAVKEVREAAQKAAKEAREAAEKTRKAAREAAEKTEKAEREKSPEEAAKEASDAALTSAKEASDAALTSAKEARIAAEKSEDALTELELAEVKFDLLSDKVDVLRDRIARATSASDGRSLRSLLNSLQKLQLSAANDWTESVYELLKNSAKAAYGTSKRAIAFDYRTAILAAVKISDPIAREVAISAAKEARDVSKEESRDSFLAAKTDARRFLGRAQVITFLAPVSVLETSGTFTVTATSTSGLTVSVASHSPSVCSVEGNTVSIIGAGQCTLTATQDGTVQFAPAQAVSHVVTVIAVPPPTTTTTTTVAPTTTVVPTTTVAPTTTVVPTTTIG